MIKMKSIILHVFCLFAASDGFLLGNTNSSHGTTTFVTVTEYYGDKTLVEHALNQVERDLTIYRDQQQRNLNLLATQLQDKINEIDKKLAEKTSMPPNIAELEKKIEEMSKKYEEINNSSETWKQKYGELFSKVTSLTHKLEIKEQENLGTLEQNVQNLNTTIYGMEQWTRTELEALRASNNQYLSMLQKMGNQLKPVIFRAVRPSVENVPAGILKFPQIEITAGIPDSTITKYKSTGKFTCPGPGYYYIILTTETPISQLTIYFMVNSTSKFQQYMTGNADGLWTPGAAAVILNLQRNDEVWIQTDDNNRFWRSGLNIFKIK